MPRRCWNFSRRSANESGSQMTAGGFFDEDPFGLPPAPDAPGQNAPQELTVSELSHKLKRVVEDEFSFVRVRGEISKVTVAKSGHLYTALKDDGAVIDAICWKGSLGRLGLKPEEGMDVVVTGRLTTYPGRSNYQLIIETMELAGQGALLKMLEDRKKKLAAEGLFDAARKKQIPYLPRVIGVVTSPTGAVIRDIMHRLNERFPRRVLLWPVVVQGAGAAQQVAAAIDGFNSLPEGSPDRPDVLIVARGGGSLEDLMPFNDEMVVRAAARSQIPLISAVGHETDTTLIDFAADLRAPTPTAAAEKAVPVRNDLLRQLREIDGRLLNAATGLARQARVRLQSLARGLGDPKRRLETAAQGLDHLSVRLERGLTAWLERKRGQLREYAGRLSARPLRAAIDNDRQKIKSLGDRMAQASRTQIGRHHDRLSALGQLLQSLSFERVLERGYAVVFDAKGNIVSGAAKVKTGDALKIRFADGEKDVAAK